MDRRIDSECIYREKCERIQTSNNWDGASRSRTKPYIHLVGINLRCVRTATLYTFSFFLMFCSSHTFSLSLSQKERHYLPIFFYIHCVCVCIATRICSSRYWGINDHFHIRHANFRCRYCCCLLKSTIAVAYQSSDFCFVTVGHFENFDSKCDSQILIRYWSDAMCTSFSFISFYSFNNFYNLFVDVCQLSNSSLVGSNWE